jgi:penicillin-binding protein 2
MEIKTGRILAMVSKPSFPPDLFASNITSEEWKSLLENPHHPLQNKGIQGQYPPGSVFKIVTAIAGLESGIITPNTQMTCNGVYPYGSQDFRCWQEKGHGTISLHRAIVESCDIYFYQVGLKVGVDRIATYASELGLEPTGFCPRKDRITFHHLKKRRYGVPGIAERLLSGGRSGISRATPLLMLISPWLMAEDSTFLWWSGSSIFTGMLKEYPVESGSGYFERLKNQLFLWEVNDAHGTGWPVASGTNKGGEDRTTSDPMAEDSRRRYGPYASAPETNLVCLLSF